MENINWKSFAEEKKGCSKISDVVVLFVTYNLSDSACNLLEYLKFQQQNFDIIIVDNSSSLYHFEKLLNCAAEMNNVRIFQSIENFGGAGGYAIAINAALELEYDYLLITEDDAIPANESVVDNLINNRNSDSRTVINFINNKSESFSLHFHLYPRNLILAAGGGPDLQLFQIDDDLEFAWRIEEAEKKMGYTSAKLLGNNGYYHPLVKKTVGRPFTIYLSCRNRLFICSKHKKKLVDSLKLCFGWSIFSWSFFFSKTNFRAIHAINSAISDFVLGKINIIQNRKRLNEYKKDELTMTFANYDLEEKIVMNDISNIESISSFIICSKRLFTLFPNQEKLNFSNILKIILSKKNVIVTSTFTPLFPLLLLSKQIILIEQIDAINGDFSMCKIVNKTKFKELKAIGGLIFGAINLIFFLPFIGLKFLFQSR